MYKRISKNGSLIMSGVALAPVAACLCKMLLIEAERLQKASMSISVAFGWFALCLLTKMS